LGKRKPWSRCIGWGCYKYSKTGVTINDYGTFLPEPDLTFFKAQGGWGGLINWFILGEISLSYLWLLDSCF
jgi:hypothetical protein